MSIFLNKAYAHPALQAGKIACITGAANGIGKATARACLARGMRVALADIKAEQLKQVEKEFIDEFGAEAKDNVLAVPTDVTSLD